MEFQKQEGRDATQGLKGKHLDYSHPSILEMVLSHLHHVT